MIRLFLYLLSLIASLLVAGRLLVVRSRLSLLFGLSMLAWALNSLALLALLLCLLLTGEARPTWTEPLLLANAVMQAAVPLMLYLYLGRKDGRS